MTKDEKRKLKNELAALQTRREEIKARMDAGEDIPQRMQDEYLANVRSARMIVAELDGGTVDAFVNEGGNGVPQSIIGSTGSMRPSGARASDYFDSFGTMLQSIVAASAPAGARVGKYSGGAIPERLSAFQNAASGGSAAVPSDGGFLVGQELSNELLTSAFETGILASRVRRRVLGANANRYKANAYDETSRADGSRYGGIRAYWGAEAADITASKPKFRQIDLELKKLTGLYYATDELLQDANALEAEIREAFGSEFGFKIDDAILHGDGVGKPLGILNSGALVSQAKETGQEAATIVVENIVGMYGRWIGQRRNGVFVTNRDTFPRLSMLSLPVGTGGAHVGLLGQSVADEPFQRMLAMPLLELEQAETLGTLGDLMLIDPSQYLWLDKGGIQSAVSIHVRFVQDEVVFRFVYRADGQPIPAGAITPYKGSDTRSPFVALADRA